MDMRKGDFTQALESAGYSVIRNDHGFKARHLKTIAFRKLGRLREAEAFARETLAIDPFDFVTLSRIDECFKRWHIQRNKEPSDHL